MLIDPTNSMHIRNVDSSKTRLCRTSSFFWSPRSSAFTPVVIAMIPSSGPNSKGGKTFSFQPHSICAATIRHCYGDAAPPVSTPQTNARNSLRFVHMLSHVFGVNLIGAVGFEARQSGNVFVTIGSHLAIAVDIDITFLVENPATEVKFTLPR